ncbi:MAG: helix-turn-helix domain-containing protein [Sphaerochaetaceae bacterium]|nr:helix-turn-helix domain-containing protein [Sphaerochaetaceae bacterium]
MGRNRKIFTDSFKKEVALEALKERNTVNEIAAKYGISASLVSSWKKKLLSGGFSKEVKQLEKGLAEAQQRIEGTYKALGKTRMENEILKKSEFIGTDPCMLVDPQLARPWERSDPAPCRFAGDACFWGSPAPPVTIGETTMRSRNCSGRRFLQKRRHSQRW